MKYNNNDTVKLDKKKKYKIREKEYKSNDKRRGAQTRITKQERKMFLKSLAYEMIPFILVALLSAVNNINGQLAWTPIQVDSQSKY